MKNKFKHVLDVQWLGSFTGIAGALLLATNTKYSAYGWLIFTASNLFWIAYAIRSNVKSILLMQIVFLATSILGSGALALLSQTTTPRGVVGSRFFEATFQQFLTRMFLVNRRKFLKTSAFGVASAIMDPSAFGMEQDFWSMPRSLWLTRPATGEEVRAVYFADGQLIPEGYRQICILLRDVRGNKAVQMSPVLLDILCGLQGTLLSYGVNSPLVTTSGYRGDSTNASTEGAARNSLHKEGRAWDGRILNVPAEITTRAALYLSGGGVGFYQDRNFTHVDDGRIRFWRG